MQTLNEWFLSLPEGRQKVLKEDKWMLAEAAFEAGKELARAEQQKAEQEDPLQKELQSMRVELKELEIQFKALGGRGAEIADRIDFLRDVLEFADEIKGPIVPAECYSDDRAAEVTFDAASYFLTAAPEVLVDLAECGWGGDYPGDYVAESVAGHNSDVQAMFDYVRLANKVPSRDVGFECHVNEEAARKWIAVIYPDLELPEGE